MSFSIIAFFPIALAVVFSSAVASAQSLAIGSSMKSDDVDTWLATGLTSDVECRHVDDIPGTVLCITSNADQLRQMMGRVSYFVEGNGPREIVSETDADYLASPQANYGGHDIMAKDFREFFGKMDIGCQNDSTLCANSLETDLRDKITGPFETSGVRNYAVIATAIGKNEIRAVISHEVLHARFFLNPQYQKVVEDFWELKVSNVHKTEIQNILGDIYDLTGPDGRLLLLNEFQAFILMLEPYYPPMGPYAVYYEEDLRASLKGLLP